MKFNTYFKTTSQTIFSASSLLLYSALKIHQMKFMNTRPLPVTLNCYRGRWY